MPHLTLPPNAIRHPKCGSWWTGNAISHCAACCETFSSTTAFDRHQSKTEPGQTCRKPETAGLVPVAKPYGTLWSLPGSDSDWTRHALPDGDDETTGDIG